MARMPILRAGCAALVPARPMPPIWMAYGAELAKHAKSKVPIAKGADRSVPFMGQAGQSDKFMLTIASEKFANLRCFMPGHTDQPAQASKIHPQTVCRFSGTGM